MQARMRIARWIGVALTLGAMVSCGGGGGGGGSSEVPQSCSANNPFRADATGPTVTASLTVEKSWVRGYMDASYLWYREIPNVNAADPLFNVDTSSGFYASIDNYFNALLTPNLSTSGLKPKDEFSFTYPTRLWDQLINSGSTAGWGIEWHYDTRDATVGTINGIRVAFVHPGSPAFDVGLQRGDLLVTIGGVTASATNNPNAYNAIISQLFPAAGQRMDFVVNRNGTTITVSPTSSGNLTLTPVGQPSVITTSNGKKVGYLLFNDHLLTAEQGLIGAFSAFTNPPIDELVLDLRYNGGGYLYIASQVAYMIASHQINSPTVGRVFERTVFNDKRGAENSDTFFFDTSCFPDPRSFNCTNVQPLPQLGLSRVYVLTSGDTCSASEAIINGLRGVGIDVIQIGTTTCGKPYGFFGQSNCGITYFPIEFQGVNAAGFGDYADGFQPDPVGSTTSNRIKGCTSSDDLGDPLGSPNEAQLATALYHVTNGACPPAPLAREAPLSASAGRTVGGLLKAPARSNGYGQMPRR